MSVVYFIQSGAGGPIKIGMASDITKRVKLLQCGNPTPLVILATIEGGRREEGLLHQRHSADRLRGEWFKPTDDVRETVAAAKSNTLSFAPAAEKWGSPMTLDSYLKREGVKSLTALSLEIGVSKGRLSQLRNATEWPPELALKIEAATDGDIKASELSAVIARAREPRDEEEAA